MITLHFERGQSLTGGPQPLGRDIRMDCGGKGVCGKCRVNVRPGESLSPPTAAEREHLTAREIADGFRLACQVQFKGPAVVTIPESSLDRPEVSPKQGGLGRIDPDPVRPMPAPGDNPAASLGIAVDIGTTTLAAYLYDLRSGQILASAAAANPQRTAGEDVISRIEHCNRYPRGLAELQDMAVAGLDHLIGRCLEIAGAERAAVDAVHVAGNATMELILAGLHPRSIGTAPYMPATRNLPAVAAADIGLELNPGTPVDFFPLVSGFVGGDTLAALLADGTVDREADTLLVDIGTNGEIVLCHAGRLWATSCATGPAFEGARISCGMRAVPGAIDQVFSDHQDIIRFHVIGEEGQAPLGLCGSGIIDAIAVLLQAGALQADGRFNPDHPGIRCEDNGAGRRFVLVPAEASGTGAEIAITQQDVRQLQLAKAALAMGIEFLMTKAGVVRLARTVLTGAFGVCFNWRSAVAIGMLPAAVTDGMVVSRVNLAGMGAAMALVNRTHARRARELQDLVQFVEMAGDPLFSDKFVQATAFPGHSVLT